MRVLLKSHNYLNILSHHNIYLKSTYAHKINTAIQPPSFHADLLALQ